MCNVIDAFKKMEELGCITDAVYSLYTKVAPSQLLYEKKYRFDSTVLCWHKMPLLLSHNCKYSYTHLEQNLTSQAVDVHEIFITRSRVRLILSYIGTLLCLITCYILLVKEKLSSGTIWQIFVVLLFTKFVQYKPVKKESVVILPAFGVQLETHYWSGRIIRRFVPHGKILRPVLNECVTPFTCYWNLALILRGEDQLMLAFQELRPPLKILVPIWKALCSSFDGKEGSISWS